MDNASREDIEKYLSDLDNLIDTGWFPDKDISDHTFYHKNRDLKSFIEEGRELIRQKICTLNKTTRKWNKI